MAGEWEDAPGGVVDKPQVEGGWEDAPTALKVPVAEAPQTDLEGAKESLEQMVKPQAGTKPGTWDYYRGLGREAFLEANPLVNLGALAIKKMTGQKTEGTLKLGPALQPPEPGFTESLKEGIKFMAERPLTAVAELAKGLVYSPELAFLSMSKGPQVAARMAELAKAGQTGRALAATGASALEGGAAMGGISVVSQAAQKEDVNLGEAGAQAAIGAAIVPIARAVGGVKKAGDAWLKKGKVSPETGGTPTLDRFAETVEEGGEIYNPSEASYKQPIVEGPKSDYSRNLDKQAIDMMQRGASKREVDAAIKRNPDLGKALEELIAQRQDALAAFAERGAPTRFAQKPLEFEQVPIEPTLEKPRSQQDPEALLDFSQFLAERRAAGLEQRGQLAHTAERLEVERRQAEQEQASRISASGGMLLNLDPVTGKLIAADQGIKGATPETIVNFGASLESAVGKMAKGQPFALDAAEKIAWEKTKTDLRVVTDELHPLTDKEIASRIADRKWVDDTLTKARQMDQMYAEIEGRSRDRQAVREAQAKREKMADALDMLEAQAVKGRPVQITGQGPKTHAAQEAERIARWKERGEADPRLLAALGLTVIGATAGAYIAGDEKIAGAVLGGLAGAGLARFGGNLAALGKTLSAKEAAWNAAKVGTVLGAGAYIGDKSGDPVYGAAVAASVLLGRAALKPATRLATDDFIAIRNGNIAAQQRITGNLVRDINTTIPEAARREAISTALDKGTPEGLAPTERKVYSAVRGFLDSMGKEAKDAEVIKGMRANYISYIVERDPLMTKEQESGILQRIFETSEGGASGSPNTKFGKQGKYESFDEINRALEGSGLKLKTKDVGEILGIYAKSMRTAIENKLLMDNLKAAKTPEGNAYLVKGDKNGNLPHGYQTLNHPQLRGYGVHPDLVDSLKVVMNNSDPNVVTRGLHALSMATKRVQVFGSLFHAKSLGEVYINAMGRDFYSVKSGVNKAPIDEALKMFHEGGLGDTLDLGIRNGLSMSIPMDVSQSILHDIGKSVDGLVPRITGKELRIGTAITDKIDWVNGKLDKLTWDYLHAGIKGAIFLKEFETMLARNAEAHAREPQKIPLKSREQIAQEVAKYSNDLTGGLDWFQIAADSKTQLGRNLGMFFAGPSGQRFAQIIAFAPDWAVSTLRAGFNSFGKSDNTLRGLLRPENTIDLYRKYALRSTLYWITLLNGINLATSGRPIWENKDPTRIEFEDGTSMQAGKHTFETVHAVMEPAKFAYNKLGYSPKMIMDFFSGKEGYGEKAPKYDSFGKHAAETALPFTASAARQKGITGAERVKRAGLSAIGLPVYGMSAEQKAQAKEERAAEKERRRRRKEGWDD